MAFDIGTKGINIKVLNRPMTYVNQILYTSQNLQSEKLKSFAPLVYPDLILILEETENEKRLMFFSREETSRKWKEIPSVVKLDKSALFRYSSKMLAVVNTTSEMLIIEPDPSHKDGYRLTKTVLHFTSQSNPVSRLIIQDFMVVAYTGEKLFFITKIGGTWKDKLLHSKISSEGAFVEALILEDKIKQGLKEMYIEQVKFSGLQVLKNMIFLSTMNWSSGTLSCHGDIFLLNNDMELEHHQTFQTMSQSLTSVSKKEESNGTYFYFSYYFTYKNGQFGYLPILRSISGRLYDDLKAACGSRCDFDELLAETISELNTNMKDERKQMFLLDPQPCLNFQLDLSGVRTSKDMWQMEGESWIKQELDKITAQVPLARKYIMDIVEDSESKESSFKMYKQNTETGGKEGNPLTSYIIGPNGTSVLGYPSYLAYQVNQTQNYKSFQILPFVGSGVGEKIVIEDEVLLRLSNGEMLVSVQNKTNPGLLPFDRELYVRRLSSFVPSEPIWVVNKSEVLSGAESYRMKEFRNKFISNRENKTQENTIQVVPFGVVSLAGSYEETTAFKINEPGNFTKSSVWRDSLGVVVKEDIMDSKDFEMPTGKSCCYEMTSESDKLVLMYTTPFNATDGMVAFHGFEVYERRIVHGTNDTWEYPTSGVIRDGRSLTGDSYLRLENTQQVRFSQTPYDQNGTYVATSWIRNEGQEFTFEAPVQFLKAALTTGGNEMISLYGQMKGEHEGWLYLEVVVDLLKIRNTLSKQNYKNTKSQVSAGAKFTITFQLEAATHPMKMLEIDHIRFSPLYPSFADVSTSVYNPHKGLLTEVILPNGKILRKLYNIYNEEIVDVSEFGNVDVFKSTTKTGNFFPIPKILQSGEDFENPKMEHQLLIIPTGSSRYELFNSYSLQNFWKISNPSSWSFPRRGTLVHDSLSASKIESNPELLFNPSSSAVRFYYNLLEEKSSIEIFLGTQSKSDPILKLECNSSRITFLSVNSLLQMEGIPNAGEIVIFAEEQTFMLWLDAIPLVDQTTSLFEGNKPWSSFSIRALGHVEFTDLLIMNEPKVNVEYHNSWGDTTQVVQIETGNQVVVSETIYDELGRDAIQAKHTRIPRKSNGDPLLFYRKDFATNINPLEASSVFHNGTLNGLVNNLNPEDNGYPYSRTKYLANMLKEPSAEGLPSREFSVSGRYAKKFSRTSEIPLLKNLFPPRDGFFEKVTIEPNGRLKVSVFDKKKNRVAYYVRVPGFDNILVVYEFDEDNLVVKILPPNYHEQVGTFLRTSPWPFDETKLTPEEKLWQTRLGIHYKYDGDGMLVEKVTPDEGSTRYSYDIFRNFRFMFTPNERNDTATDIRYFVNVGNNQPAEVGMVPGSMLIEELMKHANTTEVPGQITHQHILYPDAHSNPEMRGLAKYFYTYDIFPSKCEDSSAVEELIRFNNANQVVEKYTNATSVDYTSRFKRQYQGAHLLEMEIPLEEKLVWKYNKLGKIISIGTPSNPRAYASFTYSAMGQLLQEQIQPGTGHEFNRTYDYNSAGFMVHTEDNFNSQTIHFTDSGYGQQGHGDGIVMKTALSGKWASIENLSQEQTSWFRFPVENYNNNRIMKGCIEALKRLDYLDKDTLIPKRFLTMASISQLPLVCSSSNGLELMKVAGERLPPSLFYGHRYAYGNHQELVKAKFFHNPDDFIEPLQVDTFFKEIPTLPSLTESEQIWDSLTENNFIIVDNGRPDDKSNAVGKKGVQSPFQLDQLHAHLVSVDITAPAYTEKIMRLLFTLMVKTVTISLEEFQDNYIEWLAYKDIPTATAIIQRAKDIAALIYSMLDQKGYLSYKWDVIFQEKFIAALDHHPQFVIEIAVILEKYFDGQIGRSVYDFESYHIDPNGNHKMFYEGLYKHSIQYKNYTNQILTLTIKDPYGYPGQEETVFAFQHDALGNVVKAENKGIEMISYHPITNRPLLIELTDGRKLVFKYDAQGERILKRVFSPQNFLTDEVKYLRDEKGKVILDTRVKFGDTGEVTEKLVSTYLYSPRGFLLGFIRNGSFHVVFTDHSGSIRLVVREGKIVAGYDYWAYGKEMRSYGDPSSHIFYRFTGQEYDAETGLYNYHARLYDPSIGRFFQPDPQHQYFSPYVYSGNSPVSLVDPDGEFAIELFAALVLAVIFAYMAAASVNNTMDISKWTWDKKTFIALAFGALTGAMLPGAFVGLVGSIGLVPTILVGLAGSYLSISVQTHSWLPWHWHISSIEEWNAFLNGFAMGISIVSGFSSANGMMRELLAKGTWTSIGQAGGLFLLVYGGGFTVAAIHGKMEFEERGGWSWDLVTDPSFLNSIVDGLWTGSGLGLGIYSLARSRKKFDVGLEKDAEGTIAKTFFSKNSSWEKIKWKEILFNERNPFTQLIFGALGALVYGAYFGPTKEDGFSFNPGKWQWSKLSTYEALLNGFFTGKGFMGVLKNGWKPKENNPQHYEAQLKTEKEFWSLISYFSKAAQKFPPIPILLEGVCISRGSSLKDDLLLNEFAPIATLIIMKVLLGELSLGYSNGGFIEDFSGSQVIFPVEGELSVENCQSSNEFEFTKKCNIGSSREKIDTANGNVLKGESGQSGEIGEIQFLDHFMHWLQGLNKTLDSNLVLVERGRIPRLNAKLVHAGILSGRKLSVKCLVVTKYNIEDGMEQGRQDEVMKYIQETNPLCDVDPAVLDKVGKVDAEVLYVSLPPTEELPVKLFVANPDISKEQCQRKNEAILKQGSSASSASNRVLPPFPLHFVKKGVSFISNVLFGGQNATSNSSYVRDEPKEETINASNDFIESCQLGAWLDGKFSMDGVTCFNDDSKVSVFRVVEHSAISKTGAVNPPLKLEQDSFSKSTCSPIEFHGVPSVSCKGEKTTFVYTPYPESRLFDNLDGNMMLSRVLLNLGGKFLNFFKGEGKTFQKSELQLSTTELQALRSKLEKVEQILKENSKQENGNQGEFAWAQMKLGECFEMLNELGKGPVDISLVEIIQDQVSALYEDVIEQITVELMTTNQTGKKERDPFEKSDKTNFDFSFDRQMFDFQGKTQVFPRTQCGTYGARCNLN